MNQALAQAYQTNGERPVAYLDESYSTDRAHEQRFYLLTAVVVQANQRDLVREGLIEIVGDTWWHTTQKRQSHEGRQQIEELLGYLADPEGTERAIVSCQMTIADGDRTGEDARRKTLTRLLEYLNKDEANLGVIELFVLEERRESTQRNQDAKTKKLALEAGHISPSARLFQVSPSTESLLWLPDLVANVYRQAILGHPEEFQVIEDMTEIVTVEADVK